MIKPPVQPTGWSHLVAPPRPLKMIKLIHGLSYHLPDKIYPQEVIDWLNKLALCEYKHCRLLLINDGVWRILSDLTQDIWYDRITTNQAYEYEAAWILAQLIWRQAHASILYDTPEDLREQSLIARRTLLSLASRHWPEMVIYEQSEHDN